MMAEKRLFNAYRFWHIATQMDRNDPKIVRPEICDIVDDFIDFEIKRNIKEFADELMVTYQGGNVMLLHDVVTLLNKRGIRP